MSKNQASVVDMAVKAESGASMDRRESIVIDEKTGIAGDYHTRGSRQVTVLFKDSWEAACAELNVDLPWTTRRANVYVDGILPTDCVDKHLQIGSVLLEVTGETRPCHIMEAAQPGLRAALEPEWRGGVTCRVLQSGTIQRGDVVTIKEMTPGDITEIIIREYFESQGDWTVTKLDLGNESASDLRICNNITGCFLCEVKTIRSVQANFPYSPVSDHFVEERNKRRDEIKEWQEQNPDERLVLRKDEWEFIYGDDIQFLKKHRQARRNTEDNFKKFIETMRSHFFKSNVSELPYRIRLDSHDLYAPNHKERETFFEWIENELLAISEKRPSRNWHVQTLATGKISYSTFYQVHKPSSENDQRSEYQLMVTYPSDSGHLEMDTHYYGTFNLEAVDGNVYKALKQLDRSALREDDQFIPRVIALAFETEPSIGWKEFENYVAWVLRENPNLSAIAVLRSVTDGTPPPEEDEFWAWINWITFPITTPSVFSFVVYHSAWLENVRPLPVECFSDKWSVQFSFTK